MMTHEIQVLLRYSRYMYAWVWGEYTLIRSKKAISELQEVMTHMGHFNGSIYRGLKLNTTDVVKILNGESISLHNRGLESWTADPKIALKFGTSLSHSHILTTNVIISKRKPKKGTVVIDFTNKTVRDMVKNHMDKHAIKDSTYDTIIKEKELVMTPQCTDCKLSDIELIQMTYRGETSDTKLMKILGINRNQLFRRVKLLVAVQGKGKYKILRKNAALKNVWKRKPIRIKNAR